MSGLESLIRLHRLRLDEKRKALAELQTYRDQIAQQLTRLSEEVDREKALAAEAPMPPPGYGPYLKAMQERMNRFRAALAEADRRILGATEAIAATFREVKRYEIAEEARARRALDVQNRREAAAYDEIGIVRHARRAAEAAAAD